MTLLYQLNVSVLVSSQLAFKSPYPNSIANTGYSDFSVSDSTSLSVLVIEFYIYVWLKETMKLNKSTSWI